MQQLYVVVISCLFLCCALTSSIAAPLIAQGRNIRDFGVLPTNTSAQNKRNLQNAIDWASPRGASLWVEPADEPYRVDGGLILKQNVSLIGVHGPVGRGTKHPTKAQPVGSVFSIEDEKQAFLNVESATQVRGIQS